MRVCLKCGCTFNNYIKIEGKTRNLINRKFCLDCSPFGLHNTIDLTGQSKRDQLRIARLNQVVLPILPSPDLAYLIGVISGDGSISQLKSTYKLSIACDTNYPDLIETYMTLLKRILGGNVTVSYRKRERCADVYVYNPKLPTLLNLPSGTKTTNGYAVPEWIFESVEYIRKFMKGMIETDGGIYKIYKKGGWFWYCGFTAHHEGISAAFLRGAFILGFDFKPQSKKVALRDTKEVKRLITELGINKIREYVYN